MEWFIYALLSAFFAALVSIFGKIGLKDVDPIAATAIRAVIMAIFMIGVYFTLEKDLKGLMSKGVLFIVLSAVLGVLSWIFYFMALKKGNVSQEVAVDRSSVIIAIILSVLILGEKLTLKTGLAVILVFIGLLLLTI